MRADPNTQQRQDNHGTWLPPRRNNQLLRAAGCPAGQYFYFNGVTKRSTLYVPPPGYVLPPGAEVYKECSVYVNRAKFWTVSYDATRQAVLEGPNCQDWHEIAFHYSGQTWTSYVDHAGEHERLLVQRPNQIWVNQLLPDRYHAAQSIADEYPQFGGMVGDLPLILALIAFSMAPQYVSSTMERCVHGHAWALHNLPRGEGCKCHYCRPILLQG